MRCSNPFRQIGVGWTDDQPHCPRGPLSPTSHRDRCFLTTSAEAVFAGIPAGYAVTMTDAQNDETKQGPPNPQAEGLDEPSPPGGPLRQDGQGAGGTSGGRPDVRHDDEASGSRTNDKHASQSGGHTIPIEDEQSHPEPPSEEDAVQAENAETSLDQPSEG